MVVFCLVNGKGGVGKTATSVNLATGLTLKGHKVLLVDIDKQGNTTNYINAYDPSKPSIADVIFKDADPREVIRETGIPNLHILPAAYEPMEGANTQIVIDMTRSREYRLKPLLKLDYDYMIIDCPPDLETLTVNALAISNYVLVPIKAEFWSLEGLGRITSKIKQVRDNYNSKLKLMGVFLTMDDGSALCEDTKKSLKSTFKDKFFKTSIRYSKLFGRTTFNCVPIIYSNPKSSVGIDYTKLVEEVMENERK